jgi:hypothetical protein
MMPVNTGTEKYYLMAPVRKLFFLLLAFLPVGLRAQVITTVAGCGIPGYLGDGGPATAAYINDAFCVVVDRHGAVYFSEFGNATIRRVDTAGLITTFAGSGSMVAGYSGDHGPATAA